jgi:hypothetical protein
LLLLSMGLVFDLDCFLHVVGNACFHS